jgi:hypothetical protein
MRRRLAAGLAIASVSMLVALAVSGSFLAWFYRPTTALAYADIQSLHSTVTGGLLGCWSATSIGGCLLP